MDSNSLKEEEVAITRVADAKEQEGGWQQTRKVITKFIGTVVSVEHGQWPPRTNDDGSIVAGKEYFDIFCKDNQVLDSDDVPAMDIKDKFDFRVNCNDYRGTWYIDMFLGNMEHHKLLFPNILGKRLIWEKQTMKGSKPQFDTTNFVVVDVVEGEEAPVNPSVNPTEIILNLAEGKTEIQLANAINLSPDLRANPLFPLIQSGQVVKELLDSQKLRLDSGVYHKV